jgi:hypothetical protein
MRERHGTADPSRDLPCCRFTSLLQLTALLRIQGSEYVKSMS